MATTTKESYRDNPKLKRVGVNINFTKEQVKEYLKCAEDPVYFAQYISIISLDRGIVPFKMYDFQKDMIKTFNDNRFVIVKCPRQVGKTTTAVAFLLWTILFKDSQTVAVLANKGQTARDILGKLQLAYENLPMWLQQGVVEWNKGRVELENGSVIIANSTSSSAARSGSYNIVFLDEFAFVPSNIAYDFITSVYPVITSGTKTKILMVSTPNGMNLFYKMWMDAKEKRSNYVPFEIHWSQVPGRDQKWREETIRNTSERQFQQEFETEFLGSSNTLVSGNKLQMIHYRNPDIEHDGLKIYEAPIKADGEKVLKDHLYFMCVDVSEGRNLDSSAFSIIDASQTPYKQVATYKSPIISPILFPTVIYNAARLYNDAYILVEINNTPQVADILHSDLEYENLLKVFTGNKKPQQLSAGFARGVQLGVKMSPQVKKIGCANLKALIESDKLLITDFDTYSELTTFVASKNSFAAEDDANDDLVMSLVLFAWASTQKYFREIVNHDLRKQMQLENMNQFDEETPPVLLVNDGLHMMGDLEVIDGDLWETSTGDSTYSAYIKEFGRQL